MKKIVRNLLLILFVFNINNVMADAAGENPMSSHFIATETGPIMRKIRFLSSRLRTLKTSEDFQDFEPVFNRVFGVLEEKLRYEGNISGPLEEYNLNGRFFTRALVRLRNRFDRLRNFYSESR